MATIPIEVIVQDKEVPVPETNTETNIAVPDTGAGTLGSNTFSGSSAVNIIIPAVLLVLALATVCTLLIRRHHKHQGDKASKKEKLLVSASATIAVLAAITLISNLILPATKAATSDTTDTITPSEDKISITVTRDGGSAEASVESTATITSTSDFGYIVLLSMAEGVETSNLYLDGNVDSEYYIASTESTELTDNTWGYALAEDGEYSAVPLLDSAATVAQGSEPVAEDLSIYYGVKVSSDLPAGTYSGGEIEYVLEAMGPTIDTLTYMQDFATLSEDAKTSVLASMPKGKQYILKDKRDEKSYYISKLADGNVWMTQNLDLDLSTDTELTPADTDIAANWTPSSSTIDFTDITIDGWVGNNSAPYSANPGDIYYYTSGTTENDIQYNSLAECESVDHTDCQHYHAGNYYNWSAAVAGNDTSGFTEQYSNAPNSICPAGWRLPVGGGSSSRTGDFYNLLVGSNVLASSAPWGESYYTEDGFNIIRSNPIWFTRSGCIDNNGRLGQIDEAGFYVSSTTDNSDKSFGLSFRPSYFYPYDYIGRQFGVPIRCIVRN